MAKILERFFSSLVTLSPQKCVFVTAQKLKPNYCKFLQLSAFLPLRFFEYVQLIEGYLDISRLILKDFRCLETIQLILKRAAPSIIRIFNKKQ